jgi:hypothetical protein
LALTDIRHGERDTRAEWVTVQTAAVVILTALLASAHLVLRVLAVASPRNGESPITSSNEAVETALFYDLSDR